MATQTGSIDLTASNGVKLMAEAGFESIEENYATKGELSVQANRIGMVVANNDASSSLQLTADAMTYIGNNVTIKGTDGTTTAISGGRIQANSLSIGAFDSAAQNATLNSNISVGGRNLLRNTGNPVASDFALTRATVADGVITITPTTSSAYAKFKVDYLDFDDYGEGEFTVSFDARAVSGATYTQLKGAMVYLGFNVPSRIGYTLSTSYDRYTSHTMEGVLTYDWVRYSHTFVVPDDLTSGKATALASGSNLAVQFAMTGSYAPMQVRNVKLEMGNKATDWTPAPEDVDAAITDAAKTATSYVTEITGQNGIMVHPSTDQTTGVRITDDVDILRAGTSVANYGTTARIGTSAGKHVSIDSDSVDLMDNTTELATFGANETHLGLGDGISSVFLANDKFRMRGVTQERTPTSGSGTLHETYGNILAETVWDGPTQDESWDPSTGHSYVSRAAIDTYALVPGNEASLKLTAKAMDWQGESPETRISSGGYGPDDFDPYVNASQTYEANIEIHSETANLTNSSYVYTTASRVGYYTDIVTYAMTNGDNEWSTPAGVLLWSSSGWAMAANVTATLSYNVSTCPSGIVLHWQAYANGATQDYDHVYTFIPKQHVAVSNGKGVVCQLANGGFGFVGTKYVYVSDGSISGHSTNTATGTSSGITYNNGHWVLTEVISA